MRHLLCCLILGAFAGPGACQDFNVAPKLPELFGQIRPAKQLELQLVQWERIAPTPHQYKSQGLAVRNGRLVLSAHQNDLLSTIFEYQADTQTFQPVFQMPPKATHTSGIAFHPRNPNLMLAVDYNSDQIYAIDYAASKQQKRAVVQQTMPSNLLGTSACSFVKFEENWRLVVTDFNHSSKNYLYSVQPDGVMELVSATYRNAGFSQGITFHEGFLIESGNRVLTSYVVAHDVRKSVQEGRLNPLSAIRGPDRGIEDIAVLGNHLYTTSESSHHLYRVEMSQVIPAAGK